MTMNKNSVSQSEIQSLHVVLLILGWPHYMVNRGLKISTSEVTQHLPDVDDMAALYVLGILPLVIRVENLE